ncbi:MAG: hypothetical protein JWN95_1039 [Frankiales bacterium]|nr:hypothetical protein [Frankiales bacterium]
MKDSTRRNFLIASGATAAAGVVAITPGVAAAATARTAAAGPVSTPAGAVPLVAHISDPATGNISILVGEAEVAIHDPDLVGRITQAAAKGK